MLQAIARYMGTPQAADDSGTGRRVDANRLLAEPQAPEPLPGFHVVEVTVGQGSPAVGEPLGETNWPPGWVPVSALDDHTLRDPDPVITLAPGHRVNLLVPASPSLDLHRQPDDDVSTAPSPSDEVPRPHKQT